MIRVVILLSLLTGCTTTTLRVINTSNENNNHCIKNNRIICEWKTR